MALNKHIAKSSRVFSASSFVLLYMSLSNLRVVI
jgi:hypothetical protein